MFRRDFLSASALALGVSAPGFGQAAPLLAAQSAGKARSLLDYGAVPDGKTLNTQAIQRAIDDVFRAGGGLVYAPPGVFLTGGIVLRSRITLYLEAGCVLLGSTSNDDYAIHPGPPILGDAGARHLIFAQGADDITICGLGTIDGNGDAFWEPNHKHDIVPPQEAWKDVASGHVQAKYNNMRPSPMVEIAQCTNVRLSGVTLKNSAGWTLRPIASQSVVIDGIRIRNPYYGRNTDGMDITACTNVMVSNCDILGGDDGICLKSENFYGDVLPTRNITITNCIVSSASNGFKMGTATRGAFENIVFSNSVIYSDADKPLNTWVIGGINVETVDGGSVDGVVISNIRMQNVRTPIFVRLGSRTPREGSFLRNVLIDGVDASGAICTSSITGVPGFRPHDITISNCRLRTTEQGQPGWAQRVIPEVADKYPESWMMGHLPAYGFYVRHADRVRLRNIECIPDQPDARPAIVCDDVEDLILSGLELAAPASDQPLLDLRDTRNAWLTAMRALASVKVFVSVSGENSSAITLQANLLHPGQQAVRIDSGAPQDAAKVV